MVIKREISREDHNSFVQSMLRKAEEKNSFAPRSLHDSVDIEEVQKLTAEIKSGSKAHRSKRSDF